MKNLIAKLKEAWNENPIAVIGAGAMTATAVAKLIDAASSVQGRRAYAKSVNLRAKSQKK